MIRMFFFSHNAEIQFTTKVLLFPQASSLVTNEKEIPQSSPSIQDSDQLISNYTILCVHFTAEGNSNELKVPHLLILCKY